MDHHAYRYSIACGFASRLGGSHGFNSADLNRPGYEPYFVTITAVTWTMMSLIDDEFNNSGATFHPRALALLALPCPALPCAMFSQGSRLQW